MLKLLKKLLGFSDSGVDGLGLEIRELIKGKEIELDQGDALLYLGTEESHGRTGIYKGDGLAQVFMHYVDKSGPFTHHADDNYTKTHFNKWSPEDKEYILKLGIERSW